MNNKLSYSMIIDNNFFQKNNITIKERNIHSWINNEAITHCHNCAKEFWLLLRKHHCRACGRIFCYNCASKYIDLPVDMENYPIEPEYLTKSIESWIMLKDKSSQRVCDKCYECIYNIKVVKKLIEIFQLIQADIFCLYDLSQVCKQWKHAAVHLISKFREIQYKLPTHKLTKDEIKHIWTNRKYLIYHSRWTLQLIKSVIDSNIIQDIKILEIEELLKNKNEKRTHCFSIMCTRNCTSNISAEDAIELLQYCIKSDIISRYIIEPFKYLDENEFLCYLPYLTHYISNNENMIKIIFDKCIKSSAIRYEFFWMLHVKKLNSIKYKLLDLFDKNEKNKMLSTINVITHLDLINQDYKNKKKIVQKMNFPLYLPINPDIPYTSIDVENIHVKNSSNKPVQIPFENKVNGKNLNIIYKNENLFKDQIIVKIINLMDIILRRDENLDLDIIKYSIIPTSDKTGIIEIVENSVTIYYILEKIKSSIQNFIIEHNKNKTIQEIRGRFIKSTAAYSIIGYILGIGDRHLDNIMISKTGALFHIDYGYILGKDPKYSSQNIRITPDILDAMGGENSEDYKEFQLLCTRIYNCLRIHVGLFMNMLLILTELDCDITRDDIEKEIIKRFEPGQNTVEAKLHIANRINNSRETYEYKIIDFMHKSIKDNSIVSGVNNVLGMLYK